MFFLLWKVFLFIFLAGTFFEKFNEVKIHCKEQTKNFLPWERALPDVSVRCKLAKLSLKISEINRKVLHRVLLIFTCIYNLSTSSARSRASARSSATARRRLLFTQDRPAYLCLRLKLKVWIFIKILTHKFIEN